MRRRPVALTLLAAAAMALAGCTGGNSEAIEAQAYTDATLNDPKIPVGDGGEISVEAGDLFFQNLDGYAVDGPVTVTLDNIGEAEHNFRIDEAAGENVKVSTLGGETNSGDLLLFGQTGGSRYVYYCDIPGHRAAGMEGELFVYASEDEARDPDNPLGTTEPVS